MTPERLQEIKFLIEFYPSQGNPEWEQKAKDELFAYITTLTAERDALREKVAQLKCFRTTQHENYLYLEAQRDALAQRVQALEGGIKKFGAHDLFCPASAMIDMSKPELRGPCNCGLDAALQEPR